MHAGRGNRAAWAQETHQEVWLRLEVCIKDGNEVIVHQQIHALQPADSTVCLSDAQWMLHIGSNAWNMSEMAIAEYAQQACSPQAIENDFLLLGTDQRAAADLLERASLVARPVGAPDTLTGQTPLSPLQALVIHQLPCHLIRRVIQHLQHEQQLPWLPCIMPLI